MPQSERAPSSGEQWCRSVGMWTTKHRVSCPDLFLEFAKTSFYRRLAFVDSALRQLPALHHLVDALAHKHLTIVVEEHDANAGPVRKIGVTKRGPLRGHDSRRQDDG